MAAWKEVAIYHWRKVGRETDPALHVQRPQRAATAAKRAFCIFGDPPDTAHFIIKSDFCEQKLHSASAGMTGQGGDVGRRRRFNPLALATKAHIARANHSVVNSVSQTASHLLWMKLDVMAPLPRQKYVTHRDGKASSAFTGSELPNLEIETVLVLAAVVRQHAVRLNLAKVGF